MVRFPGNLVDPFIHGKGRAQQLIDVIQQLKADVDGSDESEKCLALGKLAELAQDYSFAIESYEKSIAANPKAVEPVARLVLCLVKTNQKSAALLRGLTMSSSYAAQKLTSLVGQPSSTLAVFGDALLANGKSDEALQAYSEASSFEPNDQYSAARTAELLIACGRYDEASLLKDRIPKSPSYSGLYALLDARQTAGNLLPAIVSIKSNLSRVAKNA